MLMNNIQCELTIHEFNKETENKYRWDCEVDYGAKFELYIPKWRVPESLPKKIYVTIEPVIKGKKPHRVNRKSIEQSATLKKQPIEALVRYFEAKTKAIRYSPQGEEKDWEIGSPYIPISLIQALIQEGSDQELFITVKWGT
jgi:hypothetical protein